MKLAKIASVIAVGFVSLPALAAYGSPFDGEGFVSDDWQLVCDNTLTCRAAGYSEDAAQWRGSILMTVKAGEKVPSTEVVLNYWDWSPSDEDMTQVDVLDNPVELWLNDKFYGEVKDSTLTNAQTVQLINDAKKSRKIVFKIDDYQWQISDKGMAAVLLKLDDTQGRVGTSLALVSKNSTTKQQLKPAKAIPKIYAVAPYPIAEYASEDEKRSDEQKYYEQLRERYSDKWQSKMSAWVLPTLNDDDRDSCNVLTSDNEWFDQERKIWTFTPIDENHTLASHPCWTGAYNFGTGYWLIDNNKPNKPKLITLSGSDYNAGEISATHKGRGLGDCWSMASWVWDGRNFSKTLEQTTGLCRLVEAGGAWNLPTYVSEVIQAQPKD